MHKAFFTQAEMIFLQLPSGLQVLSGFGDRGIQAGESCSSVAMSSRVSHLREGTALPHSSLPYVADNVTTCPAVCAQREQTHSVPHLPSSSRCSGPPSPAPCEDRPGQAAVLWLGSRGSSWQGTAPSGCPTRHRDVHVMACVGSGPVLCFPLLHDPVWQGLAFCLRSLVLFTFWGLVKEKGCAQAEGTVFSFGPPH